MKKFLVSCTTLLILVGCGGSDSAGNKTFEGPMVISTSYAVFPGDSVVKTSDEAIISIVHKDGKEESTIILTQGEATLLRQP